MMNADFELIELCMSEESENEKEEKQGEEEKQIKLQISLINIDLDNNSYGLFNALEFKSKYHPEIISPPPDPGFS